MRFEIQTCLLHYRDLLIRPLRIIEILIVPNSRISFRIFLEGPIPNLLNKRPSPQSSGQPSPAGTGSRGNTGDRIPKSNQSPLIRSREVTPNHSRQNSGQQAQAPFRSPPQPFPHPARIQSYPDSSSESEGN